MGHVDVVALNRDQAATARIEAQDELVYGAARVGRFVLGNGLRVLIWEDRRAPVFSLSDVVLRRLAGSKKRARPASRTCSST
jgi:hypothetical protein